MSPAIPRLYPPEGPLRILATLRRLAALLGAVALLLIAYGVLWGSAGLEVQTTEIPLAARDAGLDGLRVVVLADLHIGSLHFPLARVPEIVADVEAMKPDLVLLCGDYVITGVIAGDHVPPEPIAAGLAALHARDGVYAVLGNHDHWLNGTRVAHAFTAAGIPVLSDRALRIAGPHPYWVVGVDDLLTSKANVDDALAQVTDAAPVLLFTHNPDLFVRVPKRVALSLAGHTHGGQVRLPFIGAPIVPVRRGYVAGLYTVEDRRLFVTTGIGTSILPIRIGVPPRIDVLDLRAP